MKKTVKKIAIISLFMLSACSSWFDEDEPVASELGRRTPMLNSSLPPAFPNQIDAMMPPMADAGIGGGMGVVPEPPAFIGSNGVQPFPQQSPQVFATPMLPQQSNSALPMMSPVDMSAANNAAVGLPVQRRAPAFNQALAMPSAAPVQPVIQAETLSMPIPPLPKVQSRVEFPKLAQIPPAPTAPVSAEMDNRVMQMKAEMETANRKVAPETQQQIAMPIAPVLPEINAPIKAPVNSSNGQATTSFASLKPLPNTPIYKIADEPQVIVAQPRVLNTQAPTPPQNITRLSDLRPIAQRSRERSGGGRNVASIRQSNARHSTYGQY